MTENQPQPTTAFGPAERAETKRIMAYINGWVSDYERRYLWAALDELDRRDLAWRQLRQLLGLPPEHPDDSDLAERIQALLAAESELIIARPQAAREEKMAAEDAKVERLDEEAAEKPAMEQTAFGPAERAEARELLTALTRRGALLIKSEEFLELALDELDRRDKADAEDAEDAEAERLDEAKEKPAMEQTSDEEFWVWWNQNKDPDHGSRARMPLAAWQEATRQERAKAAARERELREEVECYEAMKEGVGIRIADLEAEVERLTAELAAKTRDYDGCLEALVEVRQVASEARAKLAAARRAVAALQQIACGKLLELETWPNVAGRLQEIARRVVLAAKAAGGGG